MLHIWKKQVSSVAPDEIRKAILSYEPLDDDGEVIEIYNEELKILNLTNKSLFSEFYVRRTDK